MLELLISFVPFIGIVIAVSVILWTVHWLLIKRNPDLGNERMFSRQLIMLGLTVVGLLASVLVLPISDSSRNQLIGIIGIVISGVIAFSSTTIISNLMAGVLLRITKPFRVGDFIRIGDHFGRVSERGLFDTEIQTETRELIALPNMYCISNPVATIRSSGTIISATLSLGYDIDHKQIDLLLMEAARTCGLAEPFVHILELGNFAVTYRVSGFLEEYKRLISVQSGLYGCVLDTLHSHGVEILSPSFMNQRQLGDGVSVVPVTNVVAAPADQKTSVEEMAFDKAEQAEELENEKRKLIEEIEKLENTLTEITDEEQKKTQQEVIEQRRKHLKSLEKAANQTETQSEQAEQGAAVDGDSAVLQPHQ
ncbi:MAG: mechanosensitive ion channel [Proteobacteria bacterium]|nr:mechanosensitive ion channel [Pseudomonadota bacterium]MBU1059293.1 mechanosensitive ion channel [Pseudomonadota bacterium]